MREFRRAQLLRRIVHRRAPTLARCCTGARCLLGRARTVGELHAARNRRRDWRGRDGPCYRVVSYRYTDVSHHDLTPPSSLRSYAGTRAHGGDAQPSSFRAPVDADREDRVKCHAIDSASAIAASVRGPAVRWRLVRSQARKMADKRRCSGARRVYNRLKTPQQLPVRAPRCGGAREW